MATAIVSVVLNQGNDLLLVQGTISTSPNPVTARGWVSALSSYYPPSSYCPGNGLHTLVAATVTTPALLCAALHLLAGSQPRAMTAGEQLAYCQGLLLAQNAPAAVGTALPIAG